MAGGRRSEVKEEPPPAAGDTNGVGHPPSTARRSHIPLASFEVLTGPSHCAGAPAWNHCAISARSASVMPVALFIGISRVTTTCW